MQLSLLLVLPPCLAAARVLVSPEQQAAALQAAHPEQGGRGRAGSGGVEGHRARLAELLDGLMAEPGWVPARLAARALSAGLDWEKMNMTEVAVRGQLTGCQRAPVCLDLPCGQCYDPLTSLHLDCGRLSHFQCTDLLPAACLPWTCAQAAKPPPSPPLLRNFLPRTACPGQGALRLVTASQYSDTVKMTGLGLSRNALTACSELSACWDSSCGLCYDPLDQQHAACPAGLSVPPCSALPASCRPLYCWPGETDTQSLPRPVLVRQDPIQLGIDCNV